MEFLDAEDFGAISVPKTKQETKGSNAEGKARDRSPEEN